VDVRRLSYASSPRALSTNRCAVRMRDLSIATLGKAYRRIGELNWPGREARGTFKCRVRTLHAARLNVRLHKERIDVGDWHCVDICPSDLMHIDKTHRRTCNIEPSMC